MERQRELMALRATVPAVAPVSETPLAGLFRRHELGYKNVLDTLRISLANLESDYATMLARHLDRPHEAKKLLAALFAAPGTIHLGSRSVTVRLMPAASDSERAALRAFLADLTRRRLPLPGDPDQRGSPGGLEAQIGDRLRANSGARGASRCTWRRRSARARTRAPAMR
ncbi:MAG TPA: hypothetical protein VFL83_20690 [Anaeromyxobacter sp.]|nr:hypothetical protein [Anaeromyxobacter sp.]